jgi:hypothetical protein
MSKNCHNQAQSQSIQQAQHHHTKCQNCSKYQNRILVSQIPPNVVDTSSSSSFLNLASFPFQSTSQQDLDILNSFSSTNATATTALATTKTKNTLNSNDFATANQKSNHESQRKNEFKLTSNNLLEPVSSHTYSSLNY